MTTIIAIIALIVVALCINSSKQSFANAPVLTERVEILRTIVTVSATAVVMIVAFLATNVFFTALAIYMTYVIASYFYDVAVGA